MSRIDAVGRQKQAGNIEVGCGKTKLSAQAVALDHRTAERVGAAEHLSGKVEVSDSDCLPDARATDRLTIQRDGSHAVNSEVQFFAQPFQQRHIASAFVAENKVFSHTKALNPAGLSRQTANEFLACLPAEWLVKMNQQQRIRTERFNGTQLLRQRIDQQRNTVGRDNSIGMAIKGHHQRQPFMLPGIGNGLPDDLLMTEMHAVEDTDGNADPFTGGLQLKSSVEQFQADLRFTIYNLRVKQQFAGQLMIDQV
jgi:hypothetical protein